MDLLEEYSKMLNLNPRVYCYECDEHIYNLLYMPEPGQQITADMIVPAAPEIPKPRSGEQIICPMCGKNFLTPSDKFVIKRY